MLELSLESQRISIMQGLTSTTSYRLLSCARRRDFITAFLAADSCCDTYSFLEATEDSLYQTSGASNYGLGF
jgi:hypothetical protein